jgi:hypothetical protein
MAAAKCGGECDEKKREPEYRPSKRDPAMTPGTHIIRRTCPPRRRDRARAGDGDACWGMGEGEGPRSALVNIGPAEALLVAAAFSQAEGRYAHGRRGEMKYGNELLSVLLAYALGCGGRAVVESDAGSTGSSSSGNRSDGSSGIEDSGSSSSSRELDASDDNAACVRFCATTFDSGPVAATWCGGLGCDARANQEGCACSPIHSIGF